MEKDNTLTVENSPFLFTIKMNWLRILLTTHGAHLLFIDTRKMQEEYSKMRSAFNRHNKAQNLKLARGARAFPRALRMDFKRRLKSARKLFM